MNLTYKHKDFVFIFLGVEKVIDFCTFFLFCSTIGSNSPDDIIV